MTHETEQDHQQNIAELGWDPLDPHHTHDSHANDRYLTADVHHGHVIVKWQTQLAVLLTLLFFTVLTVFITQAEIWVTNTFGVELPRWINIAGAMSIATIKALLVCAFFMQLRFDKALNTFAMLFCILGVGLFLTFTMLDLGNRGALNPFKAEYAQQGGTGVGLNITGDDGGFSLTVGPRPNTGGNALTEFSFERALLEAESESDLWKYYYKDPKHQHHRHPKDVNNYFAVYAHHGDAEASSPNRSVPRTGITPGLFDTAEPSHGGDHAADDDHADASHDESTGDDGH